MSTEGEKVLAAAEDVKDSFLKVILSLLSTLFVGFLSVSVSIFSATQLVRIADALGVIAQHYR